MRKTMAKVLIDVLLAVVFALLFNIHLLGLAFHEIVGIGIGLGIVVHIFINIQWVKKVTLRFFAAKLPLKTRLGYILNLLLLIAFIFIIVSGIFISKVLFPNFHIGSEALLKTLHISISYLTLILIGIHIGFHWKQIRDFFKNLLNLKSTKLIRLAAKLSIIILLLFGGYQIAATNFVTQLASISNVFTMTHSQNMHDGLQQRQQRAGGGGSGGKGSGFDHSSPEGMKWQFQSVNLLSVLGLIIKYSGIMSIFAILTYYIEKFLTRRNININN